MLVAQYVVVGHTGLLVGDEVFHGSGWTSIYSIVISYHAPIYAALSMHPQ